MWDLGPVPPVELTATQRYADHSSATMKFFLDAKASADTLLDLCVLHIKVNSKQQLYICYWSWNTNGVNWFHYGKGKFLGHPLIERKQDENAGTSDTPGIISLTGSSIDGIDPRAP